MKVAIVAPSPVPFGMGGAENFWQGLLCGLNATAGVQADLIKLPSDERNLKALMRSYAAFARLDVSHFTQIISSKYPAWMVQHPQHTVYVQHTLRGLYDTYPATLPRYPRRQQLDCLAISDVLRDVLTGALPSDALLTHDLAELAEHVAERVGRLPNGHPLLQFPGPFARALVHTLDALAMHPSRIRHYFAISHTVAARAEYFPSGVDVRVMHHPEHLPVPPAADQAYWFCASRLDAPKRIDWVITAYLASGSRRPLHIAGAGPDERRLRELANGHERIVFRGRLPDADLSACYANAYAVVFVPRDEDYGLITLEAMRAGKAVITCADGGGTTELVQHERTGLIAPATPEALAQAIAHADAHPAQVARWGRAGASACEGITWPRVVHTVLAPQVPAVKAGQGGSVLVINTYPIYPANSGGRLRLLSLYGALARHRPVTFACLDESLEPHTMSYRRLGPQLAEYRLGPSSAFRHARHALDERLGVSSGDLAAIEHVSLLEDWQVLVSALGHQAEVVICAHPYGYPLWQRTGLKRPLVYEAHNVETDMKAAMYAVAQANKLTNADSAMAARAAVALAERDCLQAADLITACTDEDAARLVALRGQPHPVLVLPNGADVRSTRFTPWLHRQAAAVRIGKTRPLAVFMASDHGPNVESAHWIIEASRAMPMLDIVIMGSVCHRLPNELPATVRALGMLSEAEKKRWLAIADIGLNPMLSGGGSNLKLAEMAVAGCLIVSTAFGARGSGLLAGEHYVAIEASAGPPALAQACERAVALSPAAASAITAAAHEQLRIHADWSLLGQRMHRALSHLQSPLP